MEPPEKAAWRFFEKLNLEAAHDAAFPLPVQTQRHRKHGREQVLVGGWIFTALD